MEKLGNIAMFINKINHQDCLKYLQGIPDQYIDLIYIDPPYGVNYKTDIYDDSQENIKEVSKLWLDSLYRVLKNNCHCYIFTGTKSLSFWLNNIENSEFVFNNIINIPTYCNGRYLKNNYSFRTEHLLFLSKGKAKNLNKVNFIKTSESWLNDNRNLNKKQYTYSYPNFISHLFANEKSNINKNIHPNQKNLETTKIFIKLSSNESDIVLDCFAGSGTTAIACWETNRHFLGCDKNELCVVQANKRIAKYSNPNI